MPKRFASSLFAAGFTAVLLAGITAGQAEAQPDLVPILSNPMSASVGVRNQGDTAAGPSHLTINCTKFGKLDGGCPDIPGLAAYADPAFPNKVVIEVPALEPNEIFNHDLAFWDDIDWPVGTYVFEAEADAGGVIAESNEANNDLQSSYTQLPKPGIAQPDPLHLKAKPAAKPVRPKAKLALPQQRRQAKQMILIQPAEPKRRQLRRSAN